jgi:hypothetical protein
MDNKDKTIYEPLWEDINDEYIVWTGKWRSDNYTEDEGIITIPLKKNNGGEYNIDAAIKYKTSYGKSNITRFPVIISPEMIESLNNKDVTFLEFFGKIGSREIKYSISEYNKDKITGIYLSHNPDDTGSIDLIPTEDKHIDYGDKKTNSWCTIC